MTEYRKDESADFENWLNQANRNLNESTSEADDVETMLAVTRQRAVVGLNVTQCEPCGVIDEVSCRESADLPPEGLPEGVDGYLARVRWGERDALGELLAVVRPLVARYVRSRMALFPLSAYVSALLRKLSPREREITARW